MAGSLHCRRPLVEPLLSSLLDQFLKLTFADPAVAYLLPKGEEQVGQSCRLREGTGDKSPDELRRLLSAPRRLLVHYGLQFGS